ncbi:hypothetical protein WN51_06444 [Melipona quadrifasciata]|uniref:Uncharacterized protein n=1 Tax=Melipona quadrifasciata TaxID=166423 RepID=A0A0N1IU41_9HYME|nr:hypothetical protein WN51_06444 [Melipona quadrifasciata]
MRYMKLVYLVFNKNKRTKKNLKFLFQQNDILCRSEGHECVNSTDTDQVATILTMVGNVVVRKQRHRWYECSGM